MELAVIRSFRTVPPFCRSTASRGVLLPQTRVGLAWRARCVHACVHVHSVSSVILTQRTEELRAEDAISRNFFQGPTAPGCSQRGSSDWNARFLTIWFVTK